MQIVESYILQFDIEIQNKLNALRELVHSIAPQAEERMWAGTISYKLYGKMFVHFAAYKKHIGFYPDTDVIVAFQQDLKGYKTSTGTVQFPHTQDLPLEFIGKMIQFKAESLQQFK